MNTRFFTAILFGLSLGLASSAIAQDPGVVPQQQATGNGQRGGRGMGGGMWGGRMMGGGRGLMGTVTAVTADHYTLRTDTGELYTVFFSVNTRIMKQRLRRQGSNRPRSQSGSQSASAQDSAQGPDAGGPEFIKATDIKVGDVIAAGGQLNDSEKSIGAVFVVQLDPERARQMQQMEANYGKTWLMGRVTVIDGVKVTLEGIRDKTAYSFTADENTTFRHRREPITLADIHLGDLVRVEGGIKDGLFLATTVNDIGTPQETRMGRNPAPAPASPQ